MVIRESKKIVHHYIVSFGELKKALKIKGELVSSGLWAGLCPSDEQKGVSRDREQGEIITEEKVEVKRKSRGQK